ncbi:hypothetical protein ERO13_A10G074501v2 [Gossypium hirsutum]|nr:hypothetical protein ERO13_A10G074501v2 [Gossypium hirsutum]
MVLYMLRPMKLIGFMMEVETSSARLLYLDIHEVWIVIWEENV